MIDKKKRPHLIILETLGAVFAVSLLVFYVAEVQGAAKLSFDISVLEQKILEERDKIQSLEAFFFGLNSYAVKEALFLSLNYERTDRVHYIQISDGRVAYEPR